MNSSATAEGGNLDHTRSESEPAPSGVFPQAVDWSNPRVAAILETAAECFSRGGFSTTTLADIGRELGLRKSIVHYYFTSKATLIREVQNFAYGRYLEVIRSAVAGTSSDDGPNSGFTTTSDSSSTSEAAPSLKDLWNRLSREKSIRGLNLELWSEARRNVELSERAESFEVEAQRLVGDYLFSQGKYEKHEADALATLTLAVLDGLSIREQRDQGSVDSSRAFDAFVALLSK